LNKNRGRGKRKRGGNIVRIDGKKDKKNLREIEGMERNGNKRIGRRTTTRRDKKSWTTKKKRRYVAARIGRIGNWTRIERAWKRGWKIEKGLDRVGGEGDWKCWLGRIYAWETKKKARIIIEIVDRVNREEEARRKIGEAIREQRARKEKRIEQLKKDEWTEEKEKMMRGELYQLQNEIDTEKSVKYLNKVVNEKNEVINGMEEIFIELDMHLS